MGIYGPHTMYVLALEGYSVTHELLLLDEEEMHIAVHWKNGVDVNQIIVKEKGVFTNVILPSSNKAKLRLLFEVAPLGFLNENVGGYSSDGTMYEKSWRGYETMINAEVEYILTWVDMCMVVDILFLYFLSVPPSFPSSSTKGCASVLFIKKH
ncbi:hypothetical protein NE237_032876 [Protea cynaroides]|uniref:Fructose-1-6-bisphosphatase class 1 C-terminal domain-containing protein n=1 Tax=Protea cynaroides TaxID=273540 RepID=A0A9Q0L465_9MAGN|nr:hypothetical protein NE237_032876 [Protea cynaroides]